MHRPRSPAIAHRGFTLIEMLVAVALVMLMMVLFASMFGTAVGTMRRQRALANNDQKARAVTALLRGDLEAMTYKSQLYSDSPGIVPLMAGDIVDPNQKGYFSIFENDPTCEVDDMLQFTIIVEEPITGKAQPIGRPDGSGANPNDLNQPDGDDGILGNGITWSRGAEVIYFLRSGTLYRRVLLLRDPLPHIPAYPNQPTMGTAGAGATDAAGNYYDRLMPIAYDANADLDAPVGDFWNDFDSSVSWAWDEGLGTWRMHFNSIDSLDNNRGRENHSLGLLAHRFGHSPIYITTGPGNVSHYSGGLLHYVGHGGNRWYIGAFTQEETSSPAFGCPGSANEPWEYEAITGHTVVNGVVSEYADGPRAGEDIVMTGVEAFNIEVLDEGWTLASADRADCGYPKFVNLGLPTHPAGNGPDTYNEFGGDFSLDHAGNGISNGGLFADSLFDTWHPFGSSITNHLQGPPYRPMYSMNVADFVVDPFWTPGTAHVVGDVIAFNLPPTFPNSSSIAYRCIGITGGGTSGAAGEEPEWPRMPGVEFYDNEVLWRSFDDRIGLKMIRITIRYVDAKTGGQRQLTTYHSFVES